MITPYLLYEDVAGAIRFLSKAFGFKKAGRPTSGTNGKLTHAAMKLGDDLNDGVSGTEIQEPKETRRSHADALRQRERCRRTLCACQASGSEDSRRTGGYVLRPSPLWGGGPRRASMVFLPRDQISRPQQTFLTQFQSDYRSGALTVVKIALSQAIVTANRFGIAYDNAVCDSYDSL